MDFNYISSSVGMGVEREQRSRDNLLVSVDRLLTTSGAVHHTEEVSDEKVELTSRLDVVAEEDSFPYRKGYARMAIQRSIVVDRHKYREAEPTVVIVEYSKYDTPGDKTISYAFTIGVDGDIKFEVLADVSHPDFDEDTTKLSTPATDDDVIEIGSLFSAFEANLHVEYPEARS